MTQTRDYSVLTIQSPNQRISFPLTLTGGRSKEGSKDRKDKKCEQRNRRDFSLLGHRFVDRQSSRGLLLPCRYNHQAGIVWKLRDFTVRYTPHHHSHHLKRRSFGRVFVLMFVCLLTFTHASTHVRTLNKFWALHTVHRPALCFVWKKLFFAWP